MDFLNEVGKKVWYLLYEAEFDNVDLLGSINLVGWGVWILTFKSFDGAEIYRQVLQVMSADYWAYTMIAVGFLRIFLLNRGHARDRMLGIGLSTFLWAFFFVCFFQARWSASITYISLFVTIVSIWELFRITRKWLIRRAARTHVQSHPDPLVNSP